MEGKLSYMVYLACLSPSLAGNSLRLEIRLFLPWTLASAESASSATENFLYLDATPAILLKPPRRDLAQAS